MHGGVGEDCASLVGEICVGSPPLGILPHCFIFKTFSSSWKAKPLRDNYQRNGIQTDWYFSIGSTILLLKVSSIYAVAQIFWLNYISSKRSSSFCIASGSGSLAKDMLAPRAMSSPLANVSAECCLLRKLMLLSNEPPEPGNATVVNGRFLMYKIWHQV